MNFFHALITSALIVINLAALARAASFHVKDYSLAKPVALIGLCTVTFFIEHHVGLGSLRIWPLSTALAAVYLWSQRQWLKEGFFRAELPFVAAYAIAFAWILVFPDIDNPGESLADLRLLQAHLPGTRLPPVDPWNEPFRVERYHTLLFYAAGLAGRIFGLDGGTAYNYSLCTLIALIASAAWGMFRAASVPRTYTFLLVAVLVVGGNGVSPFVSMLFPGVSDQADIVFTRAWADVRFVGLMDRSSSSTMAERLAPTTALGGHGASLDLPLENVGHVAFFLGDLHPPLASFLIAIIVLFASILWSQQQREIYLGIVGFCLAAALATSAWVFPIQAGLALMLAGVHRTASRRSGYHGLVVGFFTGVVLIYPHLTQYLGASPSVELRVIPAEAHIPPLELLLLLWPVLITGILAVLNRTSRGAHLLIAGFYALFVVVLFEFVYYHDLYSENPNSLRFNSVLKNWSWAYFVAVCAFGAAAACGPKAWVRLLSAAALAPTLAQAAHIYDYKRLFNEAAPGQLYGGAWLAQEASTREALLFLRNAPRGIALENPGDGYSYNNSGAIATLAGQPSLLGWPGHVGQMSGDLAWAMVRADKARALFRGEVADPAPLLRDWNVRYIVWTSQDSATQPNALGLLYQKLGEHYTFRVLGQTTDSVPFGIWLRKD